ncbi:secoisolariciresinol dehydrogenase-like isoform X4 [Cucurbita moschata]|uniref:Secoisolariciresinol dehydrogenase-like isoform X4 n=1 Tax=Cucurbita moschata TaxID=3662 RepID=A0A6J1EHJ0_CUCMO|nr:secoisolariciresinol dehydrogenase-like isoform X4 [Cucurbita moschata]
MGISLLPAAARRLEGKVAVITGAASGIWESTAKLFFKHGAKVVLADILDDVGHSLSRHLCSSSSSFVHCDVTKEKDIENAVNTAIFNYGKLDIILNNAGFSKTLKFNILENELSNFQKVDNVNLLGLFLGTKHAARVMIPARQGSIIMMASGCSIIGGIGPYAYMSSKHGLLGLMKNAMVHLGRYGIRVNCVSPHVVPLQMTRDLFKLEDGDEFPNIYSHFKCGDILRTEDIAEAALYLASDASRFVSGHNLIVDGGFTATNQGLYSYQ